MLNHHQLQQPSSSVLPTRCVWMLLTVVLVQWMLISYLLTSMQTQTKTSQNEAIPTLLTEATSITAKKNSRLVLSDSIATSRGADVSSAASTAAAAAASTKLGEISTVLAAATSDKSTRKIVGVYATVIFKAPKWFHLRYTQMLHNALSNLPPNDENGGVWVVQVFVNEKWANENLVPYHPGYSRLLNAGGGERPLVHFTPLPDRLVRMKPKFVNVDRWFWESMLADHVILFSGNGAFCGIHITKVPAAGASAGEISEGHAEGGTGHVIPDMILKEELDFCGVPFSRHQKSGGADDRKHDDDVIGGDGSTHSYRNRKSMIKVLDYMEKNNIKLEDGTEHALVVKIMNQMNSNGHGNFKLATLEQTRRFGGVQNLTSPEDNESSLRRLPLLVSGTLPGLSWDDRESVLKHCPEVKMIFPSMHEPACFGAHPDPVKCKASICALQDPAPKTGC